MSATREFYIRQGTVPEKCQALGMVIYMAVRRSEDPCARCLTPRTDCGGRPLRNVASPR